MKNSLLEIFDAATRLFGNEQRNGNLGGVSNTSTRLGYRLVLNGPVDVVNYETGKKGPDPCTDRIVGGHIKDALLGTFPGASSPSNDTFYENAVFSDALWATADMPVRTVSMPLSVAVAKIGRQFFVIDAAAYKDARFIAVNGDPQVLTMEQFERLKHTGHVGYLMYGPSWNDQHREAAEQAFSKTWNLPSAESQRLKRSALTARIARQLPTHERGLNDQQVWLGDIDFSGVNAAQRTQMLKRVKQMLHSDEIRLRNSQTTAKFELCAEAHKPQVSLPQGNKPVRILLVSAAAILPKTVASDGTNSCDRLRPYYQDYFRYASNGLLELDSYYASQRMAGGMEYQRAFRKNKLHYRSELLTEQGSVFVLRRSEVATDTGIAQLLQSWSDRGLPNAKDRASHTWREYPFVRENGYAEVRVNYAVIKPRVACVERSGRHFVAQ